MRRALGALAALAALAGCHRGAAHGALASEQQCKTLHAHLRQLMQAENQQELVVNLDSIATDRWIARCHERTTARQADCQIAAPSLARLTGCEPEFDWRGDDRPDEATCQKLVEHAATLARELGSGAADSARQVFARACQRDLRRRDAECMITAGDFQAMAACDSGRLTPVVPPASPASPAPPAETTPRPEDAGR